MATQEQTFWKNSYQQLYPFILKRVKDAETTQDLLQEVALRIYLHQDKLKEQEKRSSWMYQIARNVVHDYFRKQGKAVPAEGEIPIPESDADLTATFAACIPHMVDQLPPPYREAVRLSDLEGLSQKELAAQLGISYSGAKSRVQRGSCAVARHPASLLRHTDRCVWQCDRLCFSAEVTVGHGC